MRLAVSSFSFRQPLEAGTLTQLEWIEACATRLGIDGVLPAFAHFPRTDPEYVAQLRKVTIDLGMVPFGLDAPELLGLADGAPAFDAVLAVARAFGVAVIRTTLPPPGDVPPAAFAEAVGVAKRLSREAKAANVTVIVAPAAGTLGDDLPSLKHLLKDVDSAWLRACPTALVGRSAPQGRYPAYSAMPADDPAEVAAGAEHAWVILDADPGATPWDTVNGALAALRDAEAERRSAGARGS